MGHLWFGSGRSGVSRYDGQLFQTLTVQDGLAGSGVRAIYQDGEGQYWFATDQGVSRYRPPKMIPPAIFIEAVVADRRYEQVVDLALPSSLRVIGIEFRAISFKTRPQALLFRYRLRGHHEEWRTTHARSVRYQDLPVGQYLFEVQAVDRDLVYSSAPATVGLEIHLPRERVRWMAGLGVVLLLCAWQTWRVRQRDRRWRQRQESWLEEARAMQMALMPEERCELEGFDIMGRCLPAGEVGGNLFAFFRGGERLFACLADVEGRGMEAAICLRIFDGILRSETQCGNRVESIFGGLKRTLCQTRISAADLVLGELEPVSRTLRLINASRFCPRFFRASIGELVEIGPPGTGADADCGVVELRLEPGDRVLFYSAGIVQARNLQGEPFGEERLAEVFCRGCADDMSAELLLRFVIGEVKGFSRRVSQEDDQTIVVVGVERASP